MFWHRYINLILKTAANYYSFIFVDKLLTIKHIGTFCLLFCITLLLFPLLYGCGNDTRTTFMGEAEEAKVLEEISGEKSEKGAIEATRNFVVSRLGLKKNPEFPKYNFDITEEPGDVYLIKSYVDTTEDCGPKVRRHFSCRLRFEKDRWLLEELTFF